MKIKRVILLFLLFVLTISLSSCTFINGILKTVYNLQMMIPRNITMPFYT